jgi:hypothetical protein
MRNTADVTGGMPIAVLLQSISDLSFNPLVAFYDIQERKAEVLFILPPSTLGDHGRPASVCDIRHYAEWIAFLVSHFV